MPLRDALPLLVPLAVEWAQRVSAQAAIAGTPLTVDGARLAQRVGVAHPEKVRVSMADQLPFPEHATLQTAAIQAGLLGPNTAGLTLGHSIFIRSGHLTARLLSHELRHVAQYESAGSIEAFLPEYLSQIMNFGYDAAPLELDARNHEIDA